MIPRSRKETYKQKRKTRRILQFFIPSVLICLFCFFIYQNQSVQVEKPDEQTNKETIEKAPIIEVKQAPVQELDVRKESNVEMDDGKPIEVIQTSEEKSNAPVSPPIVKGNNETVEKEEKKLPAAKGVVIIHHTLKAKETLYSLIKHYYKEDQLDYLLRYNGISDPSKDAKEGDVIKVPNPDYLGTYVVQKGDTLFSIGRIYFNKSQIVQYMTDIHQSSNVKTGEKLTVFHQGKLTTHMVKDSETLYGIMNQYYQFSDFLNVIQESNHLGEQVQTGQKLLIRNPFYKTSQPVKDNNWSIEILLNTHTLTLYKDGNVYKTYSVATGKESLTPKGTFQVITKFLNPEYTRKKIAGGDPRNPLGTRWIGLNVPGTTGRTYGIHGTSDPSSIGKDVSQGCIRLLNIDVEALFEIIPIGTEVVIK
ncbi:L,D-transpeptidase family protein [Bacillus sp. BGMRC 2118]|nr:L,D-transpeptidase family protein [Bacillus sp. BGMRC 2118]